jgi:hypothetical protein
MDLAIQQKSTGSGGMPAATDTTIERKLIKDATLSWETGNVKKTHDGLIKSVNALGGYVSDDHQSSDEYEIRNRLEIHIPVEKFDSFLAGVEADVSKFDEKNIKILDVTEEYIDVATRINTKKELEQHYYALLKETRNVEEVLKVEEQLNIVRTDIESAEGRMKFLNNQIAYSTGHISFYQKISTPVGFFGEIGNSFKEGWNSLLYFILGLIRLWAYLLLFGVLFYFIIHWIKKRRNR